MKRLALLFSVLSLALAPACDDDSGGSSDSSGSGSNTPTGPTGLDGDLALSEVTDEQQIAMCEANAEANAQWQADNADMMSRALCYLQVSSTLSFLPDSDCQDLYDTCLAEGDDDWHDVACADQILDFSECTDLTVSEFEVCNQAMADAGMPALEALAAGTCEDLVAAAESDEPDAKVEALTTSRQSTPECAEVWEKCPVLDVYKSQSGNRDSESLCPDVMCDIAPYCDGDKAVEVYAAFCNGSTGECEAEGSISTECPDGCTDGECIGGLSDVDPDDDEDEDPPAAPPAE